MAKLNISPFLDAAASISGIKKVEAFLPIAGKSVQITSLNVGDDLSLRSSLTSPVGYDRDMIQILHAHSEFVEEQQNVQYPLQKFCQQISNIDKISLLWGLYKSTYDTLSGERKIICEKEDCKHEFKDIIYLDDLIHEDTYVVWDKFDENGNVVQFYNYIHEIQVIYQDYVYEFATRLPSIQNNNNILSKISIDVLQQNLEKIGTIFTRSQQMALLTKAVRLSGKNNQFQTAETDNINEILVTFHNHIPFIVGEEFFEKYSEEFDKYVPKYYKILKCPLCGHQFNYNVDLEVEFFRRCLFGRAESE